MLADMITEIEARNQLRREAGLPQLAVPAELERLKTLQRGMEYEVFYEKERPKYNHLWDRPNLGWFGGHAIWTKVRRQILVDFEVKRLRGEI